MQCNKHVYYFQNLTACIIIIKKSHFIWKCLCLNDASLGPWTLPRLKVYCSLVTTLWKVHLNRCCVKILLEIRDFLHNSSYISPTVDETLTCNHHYSVSNLIDLHLICSFCDSASLMCLFHSQLSTISQKMVHSWYVQWCRPTSLGGYIFAVEALNKRRRIILRNKPCHRETGKMRAEPL